MLAAQYSRISNFRPQSLARFKIYDIFYNSRCAKIADFGGKLTWTSKFHLAGGAFILGHESGRCSVHVNVQLLGKVGTACVPPLLSARIYVGPRAHCVFSGYFLIISPNVETHRVGGKRTMRLLYGYCQLSQIRLPVH